jgi:Protein of unknown function (DUF3102)
MTLVALATDLPARINVAHAVCAKAMTAAVRHATRAGELLLRAKAKVGHGQWQKWQRDNLKFSPRTAQLYMYFASLTVEKRNAVADLPLRTAVLRLRRDARNEENQERLRIGRTSAPERAPATVPRDVPVIVEPVKPMTAAEIVDDFLGYVIAEAKREGFAEDDFIDGLCRWFGLVRPLPQLPQLSPL